MSKYKITVENTETGEKKAFNADFYSIFANDFDAIGVVSAMGGKGDALQILQVLMAMDTHADVCLNPEDVAAMMALLKIARIATGHGKDDNWIDLAGYAACGGEIESRVREEYVRRE